MTISATAARTPLELQHEIEQFYYEEAALLDERRYGDWLALFTDEISYRMPTRSLRYRAEAAREFSGPHEIAHFDDDKQHLSMRVNRLMSGLAWSEEPASRTRHLISNVRVRSAEGVTDALDVHSAFLVYHGKGEHESHVYAGSRRDLLRSTSIGWRIARRTIFLDATVLPSNFGVLL